MRSKNRMRIRALAIPWTYSLCILIGLAVSGCATQRNYGVKPTGAIPSSDCNEYCLARAKEAQIIRSSSRRIQRIDPDLILHLANGKTVTKTDHQADCDKGPDNCELFAVVADEPRSHAFVLETFYYEGADFLIIDDRTGRHTILKGEPKFSPNGNEFLVTPDDQEIDTGDNNIEIWRRDGDSAVLEWAHPHNLNDIQAPQSSTPYHIQMKSWRDDTIALTFSTDAGWFDEKTNSVLPVQIWSGTIRRKADGWHLTAEKPH